MKVGITESNKKNNMAALWIHQRWGSSTLSRKLLHLQKVTGRWVWKEINMSTHIVHIRGRKLSTKGRGAFLWKLCLSCFSGMEAWPAKQVELCRASWEQEIQSQRSKDNPSNTILTHTYKSLGIYFGKTIPIISYPPHLSFATPIWETSV